VFRDIRQQGYLLLIEDLYYGQWIDMYRRSCRDVDKV